MKSGVSVNGAEFPEMERGFVEKRGRGQTGRRMGILTGMLAVLVFLLPMAYGSWMIDPARFHASVHGRTSCGECHEEIVDQALHPDPRNVTRVARDFFQPDECLSCHESVTDDLQKGSHGKLKINIPDSYRDCLHCHDPHYQAPITDSDRKGFNPARPVTQQCGACHEAHNALPPFSEENAACMTCHRPIAAGDPKEAERLNNLCLHCHGMTETPAQAVTQRFVPLMDGASYGTPPHANLACTACHQDALSYSHDAQQPRECGECHVPHHEKIAGSAHMSVSCQACHLKGVRAIRDTETNDVLWEKEQQPDGRSVVHEMVRFDTETGCRRCHFSGNQVGAASMVLPAKGVICMPCHAATLSAGDTISMVSLVIFALGMALLGSIYLSGSLSGTVGGNAVTRFVRVVGTAGRCIFSRHFGAIIRSLFWDVLLQRRLYRLSRGRWAIHALIFYGFVVRFIWGLATLAGSLWKPDWPVVWHLIDKDYPITAFLYDLTGVMILVGVGLAFVRGWIRNKMRAQNLPEQDRVALALIGTAVVVGFVLEGMRIALNGYPDGSAFGLIGYGIGLLFEFPRGLVEVYGFVWYIHAALAGAFIAYIPFSRLLHIIIGPVVLAMNACRRHDQGGRRD